MNYIVLDLEWNQSPSGKENSVEHLPFEIIEIGAVKLNEDFEETGSFHRLIRPQIYKTMHFKISEVTHMDMAELCHEGERFDTVMEEFFGWCGAETCRLCTWGSMDLMELQRNMAYYKVANPFPRPLLYIDVQKIYCLQYGDGKNRISLDMAVQIMGMEEERPFHRALDDAYYAGRILSVLDMDAYGMYVSVDYFRLPRTREEEYRLQFPDYSKFVSREFDTRDDILGDKNITDIKCPECNRMLRKKLRWFPYGQRFYFCLAMCPEHGFVKGKIRVRKSEEDRFYTVKTTRLAGPGDVEYLNQKKEDMRRKRNIKSCQKTASKSISPTARNGKDGRS